MSYVPRLAKVVNVLAIRQVKQETETTGFRIGFTLHSCQYMLALDLIKYNFLILNCFMQHY